jgi:tetratricopeptide (TPR) repeat protein
LKYLGVVQELTEDYTSSTTSLLKALDLYRDVGSRLGEANVLKYLGIGRERVGAYGEAEADLLNAKELYQKIGNRLGEANISNSLGDLALKTNELPKADSFYQQAIETARTGRVPFEEARGLEGNGMCHLRDGRDNEGVTLLKQALSIYRTLGSPTVSRIEAILRGYGGDENL